MGKRFTGKNPIKYSACKLSIYCSTVCILSGVQGKFSTRSDVWSFAVTLWEVLSLARQQPFDSLNNDQVIDNCGHYLHDNPCKVLLPCPPLCPKEIYDLMRECWNRDELQRPSFREIHMFLQRKNMGYNPKDETAITCPPIVLQ